MNLDNHIFQKLYRNIKHLEVVKRILCRKCFDNTGKVVYQQLVVPEELMRDMIRTLHEDIMERQTVVHKILYHLRQRYYCLNFAAKVQAFMNNLQTCIRSKLIAKQHLRTFAEDLRPD